MNVFGRFLCWWKKINTEIIKETPWDEVIHNIIAGTKNLDFYRLVAAFFFEKNPEDVTSEDRTTAKQFLYGVKYRDNDVIIGCIDDFAIPEQIREKIRNGS